MTPPVELHAGYATDRAGRETNEDAVHASNGLYVVADGMGGHEAGEVAAGVVVDVVSRLAGTSPTLAQVRDVLREAHAQVRALPAGGERRPGTTLSGVVVTEREGVTCWLVLNIGDSRTYRMVGGVLEQLTQDHSEVAQLVADGVIAVEDAARHPRRNVVTRVLGGGAPEVEPDLWIFPVSVGDRIVVCSDGLSDVLSDARIQARLRQHDDPVRAAQVLVHDALAAGGQDNVTVVVVDATGVNPA